MGTFVDRVGQKFGKLTVVARAPWNATNNKIVWLCDCECGTKRHPVSTPAIPRQQSCGCLGWPVSRKKEPLTQARLQKLLRYDPETGEFFWRVVRPRIKPGDRAGYLNDSGSGYWFISVDGNLYRAHRLAWFYVFGHFPKEIDHKNRVRSDNRIKNLRIATRRQTRANSATAIKNRTGFRGITQRGNTWLAMVRRNGKSTYLGSFSTPEAAHAAYCRAGRELYGEFFFDGKDPT